MHFMVMSATSSRDRRAAETSRGLRTEARRLTIERGLSGFTIEELCSEVGVSRRTFFNYYASKESAVLDIPVRSDLSDIDERFAAGTGALLDDFAEMHIARWERLELTATDGTERHRLFEREPRLFAHFLDFKAEGEREDVALMLRRPDAPVDEMHAETLVQVFSALIRLAIFEYFSDDSQDFRVLLLRRIAAARATLAL